MDVYAHLGHLQYSLPGSIWRKQWWKAYRTGQVPDVDHVLRETNAEYSREYNQQLQDIHTSLSSVLQPCDKIVRQPAWLLLSLLSRSDVRSLPVHRHTS